MAKKLLLPIVGDEFQIFPGLSPGEFNALKLDIREHGIMVAIEVDQDGRIVDGHHRARAWNELRAEGFKVPEYERKVRYYESDDERLEHALRFNQLRRHLTPSQRKDVVT
jgi:ParB-like chromosome segregation protein Spo0J